MTVEFKVRNLQESVTSWRGYCTSTFSQCLPPTRTLIETDKATSSGICQALVNRWIAHHANDSSMFAEFSPHPSEAKLAQSTFDLAHIQQYMREFKSGVSYGWDHNPMSTSTQKWNTEKFLWKHGVRRRQYLTGAHAGDRMFEAGGDQASHDSNLGYKIAEAIAGTSVRKRINNCYRMISIRGSSTKTRKYWFDKTVGFGHVLCAWVAEDVALFDPNWGEFWFETKQAFYDWYSWAFQDFYGQGYGAYHIRDFAKAAAHVTSMLSSKAGGCV